MAASCHERKTAMGEKTAISWTDHTFQPLDGMFSCIAGLRQLLRRGARQADRARQMGRRRRTGNDLGRL